MTPEDVPSPAWEVVAWNYAVRGDLPDEVIAEMRRAHELKNKLADLESAYAASVAAIWTSCPDVAAAQERLDQAEAEAGELAARLLASRPEDDGDQGGPAAAVPLKAASQRRAEARSALKRARTAHHAALKPRFDAALQAHRQAVKSTYRDAVDGGLFWATYNAVLASHRAAVTRVRSMHRQGRPAELHRRSWDGTGTVTVQLLRLAGERPRSPALLADARGRYRNQAHLAPWMPPGEWARMPRWVRHRAQAGTASLRIGSGESECMVTIPVVVHRMLPGTADITRLRLTRTRVGTKFRASVTVIARVPRAPARSEGGCVAVHAGWRVLSDGSIRSAVIAGAGPPPARLVDAGIVRVHGSWAEAVIPASWRELHDRIHATRSGLDQSIAALGAWLAEWLDDHPASRDVLDPEGVLAGSRSPVRFADAARRLREATPPGCEEPARRLQAWWQRNKHLVERQANERDQLLARRNDAWNNVAAWIAGNARLVVMDKWSTPSLARARGPRQDDFQERATRANRVLVSPGTLREKISLAARARGVAAELAQLPAPALHFRCGTPLDSDARKAELMVWCPGCQVKLDQDLNVLAQLLAARGCPDISGSLGV